MTTEKKARLLVQAEANIGTAGHVDHGKTTLVKALTGEWTDRHSEEIKRGITIRLGYADATFYLCEKCREPLYTTEQKCPKGHDTRFLRRVSFVDCPGHENLMTVMLSGASIMDGAMFIIAANETCPQPQTQEHLAALDITGIKNLVIVQNKVDLVSREQALKNYSQIREFVKGTVAENAPIVPVAANSGLNLDALIAALQENIPTPKREKKKNLKMVVARSFDTNRPGTEPEKLNGGVIGGSLLQGSLRVGEDIEIAPGLESKGKYEPVVTKVMNLSIRDGPLEEVHPGGLVGIGTLLDPNLTKGDGLIGNVVGRPGSLPPVRKQITIEPHLLERHVITQTVENLKKGEQLVINSGTNTTVGMVTDARKNGVEIALKKPICAEDGDKVAISRRFGMRWSLIGYGLLR